MIEFENDEVFQTIRFQIRQLYEVVSANEESKRRQWVDDAMVLRAYINALSATRKVLQKEQATVSSRLDYSGKKGIGLDITANLPEKGELLKKLQEFKKRTLEMDQELQRRYVDLKNEQRTEESVMLRDEISVLEETRTLCFQEMHSLESTINELETAEKWKAEQTADWENLAHLKDQLTKLETKIDRAKRCLLFPAVHGYRFRVGSAGIYLGAKDLYISDFSAGISLSVDTVDQSPSGEKTAIIRLNMTGHESRPIPSSKAESISDESVEMEDEKTAQSTSSSSLHTLSSIAPSDRLESLPNQDHPIETSLSEDSQRPASFPDGFHPQTNGLTLQSPEEASDPPEITDALRQGASTGKRLALGFIKRISDKDSIQQKMSKASQAIRRVGTRRTKAPSGSESLFKRFSLKTKNEISKTESTMKQTEAPVLPESQSSPVLDRKPENQLCSPAQFLTEPTNLLEMDSQSIPDGGPPGRQKKSILSKRTPSFSLGDFQTTISDLPSESMSLIGAGRRGVHVKLRGTHVNLFGEKGTRVPNMTVRELDLEVECSLSVLFEFSPKLGWTSQKGLKLEIIQLKKTSVGNSIPLPAGLVKTLLNLILPRIVERALLSMLPKELGIYLIESGKGLIAAGEIVVVGPPLCTTQAPLDAALEMDLQKLNKAEAMKKQSAVQEAQNLLSLNPAEAKILGLCFSNDSAVGLLDPRTPGAGLCSITELCRFHDRYSKTPIWLALCDLWNKAIRHILKTKGWNCGLDFGSLMNAVVGRLAAKPVRTHCLFTRLNIDLSVDHLITCMRSYCDRSARELHAEKSMQVSMPLDEQLKALDQWHLETTNRLQIFKESFKTFSASLVTHADSRSLQIGLEKCEYEGPLAFKIPVVRDSEEAGILYFDVSIPSPETSGSSDFMDGIYRAIRGIHYLRKTTETKSEKSGNGNDENHVQWGEGYDVGERLEKAILEGSKEDSEVQFDQSLNLGRVLLNKLCTSITLNEEKLREKLLEEKIQGVVQKFDELVICDFAHDPIDANRYQLNFKNSSLARFKTKINTLGFQSSVSPAEVLSIIHICLREYFTTFFQADSLRLKSLEKWFKQMIMYVDKRSLDFVLCTKLRSFVSENSLILSLTELGKSDNRSPLQITNDFDVMTLMDTFSLAQGHLEG